MAIASSRLLQGPPIQANSNRRKSKSYQSGGIGAIKTEDGDGGLSIGGSVGSSGVGSHGGRAEGEGALGGGSPDGADDLSREHCRGRRTGCAERKGGREEGQGAVLAGMGFGRYRRWSSRFSWIEVFGKVMPGKAGEASTLALT
jgi:hypothetical protein